MLVEFGNTQPKMADGNLADLGGPAVTYLSIPDEYTFEADAIDVGEFRARLASSLLQRDGITNLPDHEAALVATHPSGVWQRHSGAEGPSWVWSDDEAFQGFLAAYYGCAAGRPDDVEETHFTYAGPPGVFPGAVLDLEANITQNGRDMWARALGGGVVGATGTSTGTTSSSMTDSGASWTVNAFAGQRVVCGSVWGVIESNTATALTIDRWYAPGTPGGAAGSTPGATTVYVVLDGNPPAWFVGLTANSSSPASPSTATSLTGEITTGGGGLIRKIAPFAHTASTNTFTLTPVYTANGSDSLPVTIAKIGVFSSMVVGATPCMLFETLLSATATLSSSGDQLTCTETVTGT